MNFQQLRIIREAARRDYNLTEVANALFTSQSGVSRHIRELEEELGIEIFIRRGKRLLGMTEPGKELLVIAERMLAAGLDRVTVSRAMHLLVTICRGFAQDAVIGAREGGHPQIEALRATFAAERQGYPALRDLVDHRAEREREAALLRHGIAEIAAVAPETFTSSFIAETKSAGRSSALTPAISARSGCSPKATPARSMKFMMRSYAAWASTSATLALVSVSRRT